MTTDRRPPIDQSDDLTEAVRGAGRLLYELSIHGVGPTPDKFASFEHAAVRGEQLAISGKVRLFYFEEKNDAPFLLKDARA
jgi:hypothetical protein